MAKRQRSAASVAIEESLNAPTVDNGVDTIAQHFRVEDAIFSLTPNSKPGKWTDGTVSITLAGCVLPLGETGMYIPDARIVLLLLTNGQKRFELQMPSRSTAGGKVHLPFITGPKGSNAMIAFDEWKTQIVNRFLTERKEAVKNGAASIASIMRNSGVAVQDDTILSDLGISLPTAKPADTPAQPPATAPTN